jgi:hypothetical protein
VTKFMISAMAACMILSSQSRGEFVLTFSQSGANVVATGSGTIDLSALSYAGIRLAGGSYVASAAGGFYSGSLQEADEYTGISGPASFGTGGLFLSTTSTGDAIGILQSGFAPDLTLDLFVPLDYVSGDSLSDQSTWDNETISGMGLTPGTYTWTWGSGPTADSLVVVIPATAVPEPSSMILAATATGCVSLGAWIRRRRSAMTAA